MRHLKDCNKYEWSHTHLREASSIFLQEVVNGVFDVQKDRSGFFDKRYVTSADVARALNSTAEMTVITFDEKIKTTLEKSVPYRAFLVQSLNRELT